MATMIAPAETVTRRDIVGNRPWLRWYDTGVSATIETPNMPLARFLQLNATRYQERTAIRFFGRDMTYRDLDDSVNRFANVLLGFGISKGDRVGLLMPNCPQIVMAFYGCLRIGAVPVPTSPLSSEAELIAIWRDAGVRLVVCLSALYAQARAAQQNLLSLDQLVVTNIKEYFPPLLRMGFTLGRERRDGHRVSLVDDGMAHWLQPLLHSVSSVAPSVEVSVDDLAILQPTSGTTGIPKLAMLTHRNLVANALQIGAWFRHLAQPDGADRVLGIVPLFHIYGISTVLNYALVHGSTMILQPRFILEDVLKALDREKPGFFPGIPTMYAAINHAPHLHRYNLHGLLAAISGAAPLPHEVQVRFEDLTGAKLVEGYGLTEASPVTHCGPLEGRRKVGTIGLPLPSTEAAIVDTETGSHVLPPGQVGELIVRGPQVMAGYWQREEESAEVLRDGWLYTGDLATMDEEGFFSIVGRKKELIITGGINVYPRDVEEPLYDHPKVRKVVAVGVPHEKWGEAIKVYVVLEEGQTASAEEIIDYCRKRMARYKVPKYVEFRRSLPENLVGKVLRRKLLEEHLRAVDEARVAERASVDSSLYSTSGK